MTETAKEWAPTKHLEDLFGKISHGQWTSNSSTSGARTHEDLPEGSAPLQLYSLGTPNGMKVSIMLEELEVDYDAHVINIKNGDQFKSGFVEINPNSKIPALVDKEGPDGKALNLFESGSIVRYLAKKYQKFIPNDPNLKVEIKKWLFWQMGSLGPNGGNFVHFFVYAPGDQAQARDYGVHRFGKELMRLLEVLDKHLEGRSYMVGDNYTIADIVCFPWIHALRSGTKHESGITTSEFLQMEKYNHINTWANRIINRPAVQRGMNVCKEGVGKPWLEKK
jgi:GST-like protein